MLRTPSEFPHPGSTAYLSPHGEEVRVIQRNADGTVLIALQRLAPDRSASDTRTVARADLHEAQAAAIGRKPARQGKAA